MYSRIVIPLDGSTLAEQAVPHAVAFAKAFHLPLHLISVVDSGPMGPFGTFSLPEDYAPFARLLTDERGVAERYLADIAQQLRPDGHQVTTEVRIGPIAQVILDRLHPNDLLVMASHGRGGLSRWFMGSIAEEITRRSTTPLLLVRVHPSSDTSHPSTFVDDRLAGDEDDVTPSGY